MRDGLYSNPEKVRYQYLLSFESNSARAPVASGDLLGEDDQMNRTLESSRTEYPVGAMLPLLHTQEYCLCHGKSHGLD